MLKVVGLALGSGLDGNVRECESRLRGQGFKCESGLRGQGFKCEFGLREKGFKCESGLRGQGFKCESRLREKGFKYESGLREHTISHLEPASLLLCLKGDKPVACDGLLFTNMKEKKTNNLPSQQKKKQK